MSDIQKVLIEVENLLNKIKSIDKLNFEQAYKLKKLSVELNKLSIIK